MLHLRTLIRFPIALIAGSTLSFAHVYAAETLVDSSKQCSVKIERNVPAPMRDGTVLYSDLYRPVTQQKVPVILMRTQYGKGTPQITPSRFNSPEWFAAHCYLVVIQDVRGQYASKGQFYEYEHEEQDGYDSVEWAAHLPGALPKVGMYGSSYVGATQWLAAVSAPPSLKTIVPSNTGSDYYDGWTYEDGAFRLGFIVPWMMKTIVKTSAEQRGDFNGAQQVKKDYLDVARWMQFRPYSKFPPFHADDAQFAPYFFDALAHPADDEYWQRLSIQRRYANVKVPVLAFEGWFDSFLQGGLRNFSGMVEHGATEDARSNQRIVIGPWEHEGWGRPDSIESPHLKAIGPVGNSPVNELMLAWFDHFLKGVDNGIATGPRVDYFMLGENRWHSDDTWPPRSTIFKHYYLHSNGHAASVMGDGGLQEETTAPEHGNVPDHYTYEPWNPTPSVGGHSCCDWQSGPQGQFDQSSVEQRSDVLVYSSKPLDQPLSIVGPISVVLYASSSATDTDFTAKVVDVSPDGTALNLNNGVQVARFRESLEKPKLIKPGVIYKYEIHVWPTANQFRKGHRIRLEISSSDFPQFAPNPNTGLPFGTSSDWQAADQTIFHDAAHPSSLVLPVVDVGDGENESPMK